MADYYSIPTTLGAAKIAAAASVDEALTITHMAFGDANGIPYLPVTRVNETALVNERHRVTIEYLNVDSELPNVYITKARIPADIGGFEIVEIGLFDADGDLIYLANYPRTLKPAITQGAGGELNIKIRMMTSHSAVLTLVIDPLVITLTQADADDRYALKTELDTEAITRANADMALSIALAAEISNREDGDDAEALARLNGDLSLAISLAAEITNRENLTNQATEANLGISKIATLAQVIAGLLDTVSVTPLKLKNGYEFEYDSLTGAWHLILPSWMGGFILQGGIKDGTTANGATITFDPPFPTKCVIVLPMPDGAYDNTYTENVNIKAQTESNFQWHGSLEGVGSSNVTGKWIAAGF